MQRFIVSALFLSAAVASHAQSIKITTSNGDCTYPTGAVSEDPTVAGQLDATVPAGQSPTGTGCGSTGTSAGAVSYGPASPLGPQTQNKISNSGGSASFSFQPINATQCNASISPSAGTSVTNPICNSATACSTLQSFSATFPANSSPTNDAMYAVSVSCTGPGSATPVASPTTAAIDVSPTNIVQTACATINGSTSGIPTYTQMTGNHNVNYGSGGIKSVNVADFNSIFLKAWPGQSGVIPQFTMPFGNYISAKFTVPSTYFNNASNPSHWVGGTVQALYGDYSVGETGVNAPISMTISTTCGDFSNPATHATSTVVPNCYLNKGIADSKVQWRQAAGGATTCAVAAGQTYYLNIINADISGLSPIVGGTAGGTAASTKGSNCSSSTCNDPIANYPNTWNAYTP